MSCTGLVFARGHSHHPEGYWFEKRVKSHGFLVLKEGPSFHHLLVVHLRRCFLWSKGAPLPKPLPASPLGQGSDMIARNRGTNCCSKVLPLQLSDFQGCVKCHVLDPRLKMESSRSQSSDPSSDFYQSCLLGTFRTSPWWIQATLAHCCLGTEVHPCTAHSECTRETKCQLFRCMEFSGSPQELYSTSTAHMCTPIHVLGTQSQNRLLWVAHELDLRTGCFQALGHSGWLFVFLRRPKLWEAKLHMIGFNSHGSPWTHFLSSVRIGLCWVTQRRSTDGRGIWCVQPFARCCAHQLGLHPSRTWVVYLPALRICGQSLYCG